MKKSALLAGACSLLLLWSCNGGRNDNHDHDIHHDEEEAHGHSEEIIISPEKAQAAGIVAETVHPSGFSGVIRTGGQILPSRGDDMSVVAATDGIVTFCGEYFEGTRVEAGKPLFSIVSGNIQDGNRIGKAKVAYETAKAEYERAAMLVDSKIVSQKDFARIREEYETARMAYEALKPNPEGTGVLIESPSDGYVTDISVSEGDYVSMGTRLASISRNMNLILTADVSQRHYGMLDKIKSANFATQYGDRIFNVEALGGRLVSVGRNQSGTSYYIPVTFEFENREKLIPGTFAEVWLLTSVRDNVISVPTSALTEEQGLYFVYLKLDESCYRRQEVTPGESDGARTEIISGLSAGDNVVVKGAYNVKLASASNAIPAHTHNH